MARVRVLIDYRPALRQRTGVGEYAHQMAAALAACLPPDGRVTLFSSSWKDRLGASAVPGALTVDARVPVRVLNLAWHRLEWPPVELFAGATDVAHSMHPLLLPARRAAQVITIYDLYFLDRPDSTASEIRRDYPALVAAHARRADAVIVISEYTRSRVQTTLNVSPERITLCPPGAPSWRPREARLAGGHILFLGTIEPRKNVATLLRAYERLLGRMPEAPRLILAGRIAAESRHLLEQLARPPFLNRASHLGYVGDQERERLYREASVLVLPSLDEGFGMPALEAMTVGVPVVAANRGALPELVGDTGVLVEPQDDVAMSDAIERLLIDDSFAERCAVAGVARAAQFSWVASATRLVQAYAAAIERRAARN
jgi:glycosyltransferase involved in cell wall biosynthesis